MNLLELRNNYHKLLGKEIIRITSSEKGKHINFSDSGSKVSKAVGLGIAERMNINLTEENISGQSKGASFETLTLDYIKNAFNLLSHLRPGNWKYEVQESISAFVQYSHLANLDKYIDNNKELATILGQDYIIKPDIIISRELISNDEINTNDRILTDNEIGNLSIVRNHNNPQEEKILHASISCKWTLRSDRSQNTRAEALNLIRNRKGRLPHIMAITAEPLPSRIASLALGTGDLDCVYHIALNEMVDTISNSEFETQREMLVTLIDGKRLRDVSDLVFDLLM